MHSSGKCAIRCSGRFGGVCLGDVHPTCGQTDACKNTTFSQLLCGQ